MGIERSVLHHVGDIYKLDLTGALLIDAGKRCFTELSRVYKKYNHCSSFLFLKKKIHLTFRTPGFGKPVFTSEEVYRKTFDIQEKVIVEKLLVVEKVKLIS